MGKEKRDGSGKEKRDYGQGGLTEDEVILAQLAVADLLLQRVAAEVDVDVHLLGVEDSLHLLGVGVEADADRDDQDLPRAQPEGPLAREVFAEDAHEPLYTTGHCEEGRLSECRFSTYQLYIGTYWRGGS